MVRRGSWKLVTAIVGLVLVSMPLSGYAGGTVNLQRGFVGPDAFEPDDSDQEAQQLLLAGVPQAHSFHTPNDVDWVYFDVEAGERVLLFTTGNSCDTFLTLYAPDATTVLADDDDGGNGSNAAIRYTVRDGGAYYARVRQYAGSVSCGPYQLVGRVVPAPAADVYEPDNGPQQAKALPTDGTVQTRTMHEVGDHDWVSLTVTPNSALTITTTGSCDTVITLFAADGQTRLAEDDDGGADNNGSITYTFVVEGTYFARIRHYNESSGSCDEYQVVARAVPPSLVDSFEPDDASDQAKALPLDGSSQRRSLHVASDADWVTIPLNVNDRIFIFTSGPCDTVLTLYAPDGTTMLAEDDDSGDGPNAALLFQAPERATYYARVSAYPRGATGCPSYDLSGALVSAGASPTAVPTGTTPTATPRATPSVTPTRPAASPTAAPGASPTPRR